MKFVWTDISDNKLRAEVKHENSDPNSDLMGRISCELRFDRENCISEVGVKFHSFYEGLSKQLIENITNEIRSELENLGFKCADPNGSSSEKETGLRVL